jgi:hypothetical protein
MTLAASDPGVDHPQIPVFLGRNREDDAVLMDGPTGADADRVKLRAKCVPVALPAQPNRYNASTMAISPRWYRENAHACAWRAEHSRDPLAKAAYREMVRAWLILAASAEELLKRPLHEVCVGEHVLAA